MAKVNSLWANYLHDPSETIDRLLIGKLHSGNFFFGFEAGDADIWVIGDPAPTLAYIRPQGSVTSDSKFAFNGTTGLYVLPQDSDDWYNFEGLGGMSFVVSGSDLTELKRLLGNCAGEKFSFVDMSNY